MAILLEAQIPRDRLTVLGRGEADPIASNDTPDGRNSNRRTDLVISNVATDSTISVNPSAAVPKGAQGNTTTTNGTALPAAGGMAPGGQKP